ncbi:MAG: hypothetical protein GEU95_21345 [Rhizobiales bacterium]|nr:hypothetical protein [Hyphomicrobiales bacterium]
MRFLLVPLGYFAAGIAATVVVLVAWWQFADAAVGQQPDSPDFAVLSAVIGGPLLLIVMLIYILLPVSIGILISEAFAIRSWVFHVLNGVVATWLGWQFFGGEAGTGTPFDQPVVVIAAGIAAGFAYWVVAGFSAGFYKPVFRTEVPRPVAATSGNQRPV